MKWFKTLTMRRKRPKSREGGGREGEGRSSGLIRLQGREEEGKGKEGGAASSVSRGGRRKGRGNEGGRGGGEERRIDLWVRKWL
uniref:Uncharacterized protein n=1 Tax=Oryza sativa subsp. japonica TaxID=39947 RepID=I7GSI9_ORYSJ|nr:hypothetical protein [Oryza sativa Japonica Group]